MRFRLCNSVLRSLVLATGIGCVISAPVLGQDSEFNDELPRELEGVTIVEHLDEQLPLDLEFIGDDGKPIVLRELFDGKRPVVLQMGYYRCPMLCNLVLNEAIEGLGGIEDLSAGEDFRLLSVSVNPEESYELASVKKEGYLLEYNRDGASRGFHFLVGSAENSKALADSVGFEYKLQESGEYSHAAALFVITPEGKISRYLYGVQYEPRTLRFALMEGAEGRIGSTLQRFILWCHAYDPDSGGYVLLAQRIMQLGGIITVFVLVVGVGLLWLRDRDKQVRTSKANAQSSQHTTDTIDGIGGHA